MASEPNELTFLDILQYGASMTLLVFFVQAGLYWLSTGIQIGALLIPSADRMTVEFNYSVSILLMMVLPLLISLIPRGRTLFCLTWIYKNQPKSLPLLLGVLALAFFILHALPIAIGWTVWFRTQEGFSLF